MLAREGFGEGEGARAAGGAEEEDMHCLWFFWFLFVGLFQSLGLGLIC